MALVSNFCDICYKIDNESLKDISQVNMKHLNDILITFVGHADIINYNVIHLCHLCCVELTRVNKFREMCLSNLIQMRQRYINMTLEDNACAVQNTLQTFVYEVLRNSFLEKSNGPVLISTDCHGIIKGAEYVNKDCLVFNRQVTNLQLGTNECDINGACSKVSGINSVTGCDESPVAVTNEDIKNEMLTPENTKLEKFEGEYDEDFDVSDANNDNKSDTSQIDFIKEECDLKSETQNNDSENLTLKNDKNEFDEHANLDVKMPVVYNSDESPVAVTNEEDIKNEMLTPENTKLQKFEGESDEDFDVSDANNDNKSDTSQIDFIKEEYDLKSERENNDSGNLILKNDENEFDEHANLDVKMPVVYNSGGSVSSGIAFTKQELIVKQENSDSKGLELQTMEDGFGDGLNVSFQIANVSTIVNMEECEQGNITSEDAKGGMKLRNRGSNNKSSIRIVKTRPSSSHVRTGVYSDAELDTDATSKKSFRTRHSSIRRERSCNGGGSYECTVCNKTFMHSSNLSRHKRIHSGDKPFKCTVCNKSFTELSNLDEHKRIHSGDRRPFKCTVCNKSFTQATDLVSHKRLHSGDRPFKCTMCNKSYTRSSHLTVHKHIHSGDRPFKCTVCNKSYTQSSYLTVHKRTHSGDRPFKCTVCNKSFTELSNLKEHKRIHSGDRPFKCTVCNKAFTRSSNLTVHKRIHSGDRPFKCTVCNKSFTTSSGLTQHKRIHSGDRPFKCMMCNKSFTQSAHLTVHKRKHSGDRPFKCTMCNMSFTELSHLTVHKRKHSGDKPFKCTVCNKSFICSSNLAVHKRKHSGDRPFKCVVCNKSFTQSSHLAVHKRKHSGDRPFKCTVCNKSFIYAIYLAKHERIHSGDRPFKCTVCNKAFTQSSHLIRHKRIHSGDRPFKCTVCNKSFACSSSFAVHKRIHSDDRPFKCTVCNKSYTTSSSLTVHKRKHSGDRPFKCTVCNKSFICSSSLAVHKRKHSGDRPFKCTVCNKSFTELSNLVKHKRTHSGNSP